MINWNNIKFRASSWGNLLAESKEKGNPIGKTCAGELLKIYAQVVYGRKEDIVTAAMDKGKQVEQEAIAILSMVDNELYLKNDDQLENDWCSGHPDIITPTEVHDIKASWSLFTFLPKLLEEPDKGYVAQLNCYYSLTQTQGGSICYVLASAPEGIVEAEKRRLLYQMNVATELNPEYIKAANELEKNMIYKDIHISERVIKKYVPRDEELIEKMQKKVPIMREWLEKFHKKHMALYPKEELV